MTNWVSGMQLTADRLNDNSVTETTTTGLAASTGFAVNSFSGRRVNGITTVMAQVDRTGALITETAAGNGNITDTAMCTFPSGWRPPETVNTIWSNGFNDGECTITSTGVVTVRTTSGSVGMATGTTVRISTTWITG